VRGNGGNIKAGGYMDMKKNSYGALRARGAATSRMRKLIDKQFSAMRDEALRDLPAASVRPGRKNTNTYI